MQCMAANWPSKIGLYVFGVLINKFNKAIQIGNLELEYENFFWAFARNEFLRQEH